MPETREEMLARMDRMRANRRGKGELTPKQQADMAEADAARRPMSTPADAEIERCCQVALTFVGSLDPGWKERIEIMLEVRNFCARQALGAMMGYCLDRSLHLEIPSHPFFEPGNHPMLEKPCEECGVMFSPKVPGERFHDNNCGFAFQRKQARKAG